MWEPEILQEDSLRDHSRSIRLRIPDDWLMRTQFPRLKLLWWMMKLICMNRTPVGDLSPLTVPGTTTLRKLPTPSPSTRRRRRNGCGRRRRVRSKREQRAPHKCPSGGGANVDTPKPITTLTSQKSIPWMRQRGKPALWVCEVSPLVRRGAPYEATMKRRRWLRPGWRYDLLCLVGVLAAGAVGASALELRKAHRWLQQERIALQEFTRSIKGQAVFMEEIRTMARESATETKAQFRAICRKVKCHAGVETH